MSRGVELLEQIAHDTAAALVDIRAELRALRTEATTELRAMPSDSAAEARQLRGDVRWLLRLLLTGFVGTWALVAHGLHCSRDRARLDRVDRAAAIGAASRCAARVEPCNRRVSAPLPGVGI